MVLSASPVIATEDNAPAKSTEVVVCVTSVSLVEEALTANVSGCVHVVGLRVLL